MKHFVFPGIWTVVSLFLAALVGYEFTPVGGAMGHSVFTAVTSVIVLGILEISLSFDNAVANAVKLETMDAVWQKRFTRWGIPIAVIGMRTIFPIVIISLFARLGPVDAINIAIFDPVKYASILSGAKPYIMAFGGTFLGIIGLKFMFDTEKDVHWIAFIEKRLTYFGELESFEYALILLVLFVVSMFAPKGVDSFTLMASGCMGMVTHIFVDAIGTFLEKWDESSGSAVQSGLGAFIFLEFMDASFSFDGVIGAFAISTNLFIVALGLGIGAAYVRGLTLQLVETKALKTYRYLEHGAFWAILSLYAIMMISISHEISEMVTGLIGAGLIGLAFVTSIFGKTPEGTAD